MVSHPFCGSKYGSILDLKACHLVKGLKIYSCRSQRQELLRSHLAVQGSQNRLRARVKEILGESDSQVVSSENMSDVVAHVDELLKIDPSDARHLFWEEMKRIFYAMREVKLEDLDEETISGC